MLSPAGRALAKAQVELLANYFTPLKRRVETHPDGLYRLGGLATNTKDAVRAFHQGLAPSESTVVFMTDVSDWTDVDIELKPGRTASGVALDETRVGAGGIEIRLE